jgi:hypothetical protein
LLGNKEQRKEPQKNRNPLPKTHPDDCCIHWDKEDKKKQGLAIPTKSYSKQSSFPVAPIYEKHFFHESAARKGNAEVREQERFTCVTNFATKQPGGNLPCWLKNEPKTPAETTIDRLITVKTKRA